MQEMVDKSIDLIYLDSSFQLQGTTTMLFYGKGIDISQNEAFCDMWYWDTRSKELYNSIVENVSKATEQKRVSLQ